MLKTIERNELFLIWIVADIFKECLYIPKMVKNNSRNLSRPEAKLYFEHKNRYPTFAEVIV